MTRVRRLAPGQQQPWWLAGVANIPSAPYPSGSRYLLPQLQPSGRFCGFCDGELLSPNQRAMYCSDPVCKAIRDRRSRARRRAAS
jgi:hypothetical protein